MRSISGSLAALVPTLVLSLALPAGAADDAPAAALPDATRHDPDLTGHAIYERVLDNRFHSYKQELSMDSGDRGGNVQATVLEVKYLSFRDQSDSILSKTIMKYLDPMDVRHLGYLVINKTDGSEDQFVYRPSTRRVRRINLRGEAIFGTDFSFEDIIPQELENGTYRRLDDTAVGDQPVYVVEVTPVEEQDSDYSKFDVYVQRDSFVPLRVVYWDRDGVKIKELNAEPDSIQRFEDEEKGQKKVVYQAMRQKIVHLKLDSWTELRVQKLEPGFRLRRKDFSERELTKGR